jgi:hypothetical protein
LSYLGSGTEFGAPYLSLKANLGVCPYQAAVPSGVGSYSFVPAMITTDHVMAWAVYADGYGHTEDMRLPWVSGTYGVPRAYGIEAVQVSGVVVKQRLGIVSPAQPAASFMPPPSSGTFPSRGISDGGWNIASGGLVSDHVSQLWCLKNAVLSDVLSPVTGGQATWTCAHKEAYELKTSDDLGSTGAFRKECWVLAGEVRYYQGMEAVAGGGEQCPEGIAGIGCQLGSVGDAIANFSGQLIDLPNTLLDLLMRLFVPTAMSTNAIVSLRDAVVSRPPWSVVQASIDTAVSIAAGLNSSSCVRPAVDLSAIHAGNNMMLPSRCGGFTDSAMFEAAYQLVRLAIYGALAWALWGIGSAAINSKGG